jgi:hypothetical protein
MPEPILNTAHNGTYARLNWSIKLSVVGGQIVGPLRPRNVDLTLL